MSVVRDVLATCIGLVFRVEVYRALELLVSGFEGFRFQRHCFFTLISPLIWSFLNLARAIE
jgi:uncharacterized membrane protein YeiH